jgi:hypothetical protein
MIGSATAFLVGQRGRHATYPQYAALHLPRSPNERLDVTHYVEDMDVEHVRVQFLRRFLDSHRG